MLAAIRLYLQAVAEAPSEATPYSNLSAAYYEIGNYQQCAEAVQNAKELCSEESLLSKLGPRAVKSHLYAKDFEGARSALEALGDHPDKTVFETACQIGQAVARSADQARAKLFQQLPRYLPVILPGTEFYPFGHDDAWSQVDELMMSRPWKSPVAIFFGGIGDARNLYATIIDIARMEERVSKPPKRKYHATANDIKDVALARNLVMFYLLDDLSQMETSVNDEPIELLATIYFTYAGHVMPSYIANRLQKVIKRVAAALRSGEDLLSWVDVRDSDINGLLECLDAWQGELKTRYSVNEFVEYSTKYFRQEENRIIQQLGQGRERTGCLNEIDYYRQTGALWPPASLVKHHEPSLMIDRANPMSCWKTAKSHVRQQWKVNVTMLDRGWDNGTTAGGPDGVVAPDPFRLMSELFDLTEIETPKDTTSLYDFVVHFFLRVAQSLAKIRDRLRVETVLGEVSDVLDRIRYGIMARKKSFPRSYNRIHMSNVPCVYLQH